MFRLWGKLFHNTHLIRDMVVCDDSQLNRTRKIFAAIETLCLEFDLSQPVWLNANIAEFQKHSKVRFRKENFMETIDFDYMEIEVIEED